MEALTSPSHKMAKTSCADVMRLACASFSNFDLHVCHLNKMLILLLMQLLLVAC